MFPWSPVVLTLILVVVPLWRSCRKTSRAKFVSPVTRLVASETKVTKRPSALSAGAELLPFPSAPPVATLTRVVARLCRSWTKTSLALFASPGTRFDASEWNATMRPSRLTAGAKLWPFACVPPLSTLTRTVVPAWRSRAKTSLALLVSPATRFVASE
jgi:hypothetical protein